MEFVEVSSTTQPTLVVSDWAVFSEELHKMSWVAVKDVYKILGWCEQDRSNTAIIVNITAIDMVWMNNKKHHISFIGLIFPRLFPLSESQEEESKLPSPLHIHQTYFKVGVKWKKHLDSNLSAWLKRLLLANGADEAGGVVGLAQGGDHFSLHKVPAAIATSAVHALVIQRAQILTILHEESPLGEVAATNCKPHRHSVGVGQE